MKFGEKVRLLRNEKKLSQTELGKMCGLSLRTIRNYEVDGRYPKRRKHTQTFRRAWMRDKLPMKSSYCKRGKSIPSKV